MATITKGFLTSTINGIKINSTYPSNSGNYTNKSSRDVKYVVMHYTGNDDDSALNNAKYFHNGKRSASAHFFVDETNIYQSVELRDQAWHCGTSLGYKTACRNSNSFGIEMCTSGNYNINKKTQINTAYLCAELCKMIGITASTVDTYVLRHYDVGKNNKSCPAQFVKNPDQWKQFKTWVKNILNTGSHILKEGSSAEKENKVLEWQKAAVKDGFTFPKYGCDGSWGSECEKVAKEAVVKKRVTYKYKNLTKIVQVAIGVTPDGKFGSKSKKALIAWQEKKGLTPDGCVGLNTWKKILGVK